MFLGVLYSYIDAPNMVDEIKECGMGGNVVRMGDIRNARTIVVGRPKV